MSPNKFDIYKEWSSKIFYKTDDPNVLLVRFKDVVHWRWQIRKIPWTWKLREEFCYYFYRLLEREWIRTHIAERINYLKLDWDKALCNEWWIYVQKLDMIALELITRYIARWNWTDNHKYPLIEAWTILDPPINELCLKWKKWVNNLDYEWLSEFDKKIHSFLQKIPMINRLLLPKNIIRDDPRIGPDMIIALNKYCNDENIRWHLPENMDEIKYLDELSKKVNWILREFLMNQWWTLEDWKFEVWIPRRSIRTFRVWDEYTQDSLRVRDAKWESLIKDLHREQKSSNQIYDWYAKLTEAIKEYVS